MFTRMTYKNVRFFCKLCPLSPQNFLWHHLQANCFSKFNETVIIINTCKKKSMVYSKLGHDWK